MRGGPRDNWKKWFSIDVRISVEVVVLRCQANNHTNFEKHKIVTQQFNWESLVEKNSRFACGSSFFFLTQRELGQELRMLTAAKNKGGQDGVIEKMYHLHKNICIIFFSLFLVWRINWYIRIRATSHTVRNDHDESAHEKHFNYILLFPLGKRYLNCPDSE